MIIKGKMYLLDMKTASTKGLSKVLKTFFRIAVSAAKAHMA